MEALEADGRLVYSANGVPRLKRYTDDGDGVVVASVIDGVTGDVGDTVGIDVYQLDNVINVQTGAVTIVGAPDNLSIATDKTTIQTDARGGECARTFARLLRKRRRRRDRHQHAGVRGVQQEDQRLVGARERGCRPGLRRDQAQEFVDRQRARVVGDDERPALGRDVLHALALHPEPAVEQRPQQREQDVVGQVGVEAELVGLVLAGQAPAEELQAAGELLLPAGRGHRRDVGLVVVGP